MSAVADYAPAISHQQNEERQWKLSIELVKIRYIIWVRKDKGDKILVGFAMKPKISLKMQKKSHKEESRFHSCQWFIYWRSRFCMDTNVVKIIDRKEMWIVYLRWQNLI